MADAATATGSESIGDETPNQRLARLRREKRQAKMAEQGEDRLARIKALNGGIAPPDEVLGGPGPQVASVADDPEEVDISQNQSGFGTPSKQSVDANQSPLAAAMLQMQQQQQQQANKQQQGGEEEDPMTKMMQSVIGLMGGDPNDPNAKPPEIPPMLKAMMGGGQAAEEDAPPATGSVYLWKIVHAIFAFILATYMALTSTFNGSIMARSESVYTNEEGYGFGRRLFLIFCTAELLLQSSRYFVEKGQLKGHGLFAKVANSGFLPEPWAGYVRVMGRYVAIAQTIFADAMVIIFVFGVLAWFRGMPTA